MHDIYEPRILKLKVYCVNNEPCFYGCDGDDAVYSLHDKEKIKRLAFIDKLQHRDVMPQDLPELIVHDQMSDEDFEYLKSKNVLAKEIEVLFDKIKSLKSNLNLLNEQTNLQKTVADVIVLPHHDGVPTIEEKKPQPETDDGGVQSLGTKSVFDQIIDICRQPATQSRQVEEMIRKIVSEMISGSGTGKVAGQDEDETTLV